MYTKVATLSLAALASASPVARSLSTSKAYQLQAQLVDPAKDLNPPISGQFLSTAHTGAGLNVATLSANADPSSPPFYTNGTSTDGFVDVLNDLGTDFSWGIIVQGSDATDPNFPGEHSVSVNAGGGSDGMGIQATDTTAQLHAPESGDFAVCTRHVDTLNEDLPVVRFVYEGETIPEGCVGVQFVPICAQLNDLPADSQTTHDFVQEVPCVASS
ncbi:uncharacterized protein F4822DRAFT_427421 [Hypoxylon trugodes]|uniref:uncharacterized protein n=1 Tax=Hypoxylon trugodes TaxID=326681 RepID=UPI0021A04E12|nr:uncharacterized protein F4822DRAFT_427421 [Hypoxylon trugodes]KAI1391567.1 hypothetical protein F4822DRAFT_427421 [Hypoxylon trugodes]